MPVSGLRLAVAASIVATIRVMGPACGTTTAQPAPPEVVAVEETPTPAALPDAAVVPPQPPPPEAGLPPYCGDGKIDPGELCDDGVNDRLGGGCLPGCGAFDDSDAVFAPPLRTIEITLPPADYELMRHETRDRHLILGGADCRAFPLVSPYTWYQGEVKIDGNVFTKMGIRKKGLIGSQSTIHPSIKLDFDRFVPGRRFHSMDGFSIDNNKSDPSYARACAAYKTFAAAKVPAPRCNHARVFINGVEHGIYTLHEEVDKGFLKRNFADPTGNLYEGTVNDFVPHSVYGFEKETNETDPSRGDLVKLMEALTVDDANLLKEVGKLVDLEAFYRFWAAEVLVWHTDGYTGNANNFLVYADPKDGGRFHFLPWGVDATLRAANAGAVQAYAMLPWRLYQIPAARDRYFQILDDLLAKAWKPGALMAGVNAIGALADPLLSPADRGVRVAAGTALNDIINGRAAAIAKARASGPPPWTQPPRYPACRIKVGTVSGAFWTTWGTIADDPFTSGAGTLTFTVDGVTTTTGLTGTRAGSTPSLSPRFQLIGDDGLLRYTMTVPYPDTNWFDSIDAVGSSPINSPPHAITIVETDRSVTPNVTLRRFELGLGTWTFSQTSMTDGQPVTGTFTGNLYLAP